MPTSLNSFKDLMSLLLSLWCKPILGSSKIYKTFVRLDPICVANLILWASPPDKVLDVLFRVR